MIQYQDDNVTVFQSALYHTTSTVVLTDDLVLVVDPTWLPQEIEEIEQRVSRIRGSKPLYLLFTHSDWDHVIGYRAFSDAITIGSHRTHANPGREAILEQIHDFDARYYIRRNYEIAYPSIDVVVDQDGQHLQVGGTSLTFFLSPGHSACGVFTVVEPIGLFLAGDYLSDLEFPYIYDGSMAYEQTLEKVSKILDEHRIQVMVPGHGNATTDTEEIRHRHQASKEYISTLRGLLRQNRQKDIDAMLDHVPFPRSMKLFHKDNQALMRKEITS
jgi:hydroxyacylglutathione hydrolase